MARLLSRTIGVVSTMRAVRSDGSVDLDLLVVGLLWCSVDIAETGGDVFLRGAAQHHRRPAVRNGRLLTACGAPRRLYVARFVWSERPW